MPCGSFEGLKKRCYLSKDRRGKDLISGHLIDKIYRVKIQHIFFRNILLEFKKKVGFSRYNFLIEVHVFVLAFYF